MSSTPKNDTNDIELTEEQEERIRRNRERALEIRRRKQKEKEEAAAAATLQQSIISKTSKSSSGHSNVNPYAETSKSTEGSTSICKDYPDEITTSQNYHSTTSLPKNDTTANKSQDEDIELEDFEIDASPYVTKQQAMKQYCLPPGTLAVCSYIEKDNPRQSKWSKMKLYDRSEIRRRARERFGGLEGLIDERNKREKKRFERDYQSAHDVFDSSRKRQKK